MKQGLDKILSLLKKDGGKFIIVEEGQPKAVLMSFQEYENLIGARAQKRSVIDADNGVEGVNRQITRAQLDQKESDDLFEQVVDKAFNLEDEELTIEPL